MISLPISVLDPQIFEHKSSQYSILRNSDRTTYQICDHENLILSNDNFSELKFYCRIPENFFKILYLVIFYYNSFIFQ